MRSAGRGRVCLSVVAVAGVLGSLAATPVAADTTYQIPRLVEVRAATHPGYDRIVFQFDRAAPPSVKVTSVPVFISDFVGMPVPLPGRGRLRVVIQFAQAHNDAGQPTVDLEQAFALPSIMSLRPGGDGEGVITVGVGLAKMADFDVHRFKNPGRIVVDVSNSFAWKYRSVAFQNRPNYTAGVAPYVTRTTRPVPQGSPAVGLLDRLFAGPTESERAAGLRVVRSRATGFADVRVTNGIARVRLTGGCNSGGSTFTVANEIRSTLRPLTSVRWTKIYDAKGRTESPSGKSDSIPQCLEP